MNNKTATMLRMVLRPETLPGERDAAIRNLHRTLSPGEIEEIIGGKNIDGGRFNTDQMVEYYKRVAVQLRDQNQRLVSNNLRLIDQVESKNLEIQNLKRIRFATYIEHLSAIAFILILVSALLFMVRW